MFESGEIEFLVRDHMSEAAKASRLNRLMSVVIMRWWSGDARCLVEERRRNSMPFGVLFA